MTTTPRRSSIPKVTTEQDDDKAATEAAAGTAAAEPEPAPEPEPAKAEESGTRYLNVTGGPLVYDREGHQVAGGDWTPPVNLDAIGQRQRRLDHLRPPSAL